MTVASKSIKSLPSASTLMKNYPEIIFTVRDKIMDTA